MTEAELQKSCGKLWNTAEVQKDFVIHNFLAPFISVTRKSDGVNGSMEFQHDPRFYFNFKESS